MEDTDAASLKEKSARWDKLVLERAELEGFTKTEARKILAEINREAEEKIRAKFAAETVQESDAANFEYAKMAMCENPNAKTIFDLQCATWNHLEHLIRHDADTKATFNVLRKAGAKYPDPKHFATTELGEALYYCTLETLLRGKSDRWRAVLELLRDGLSPDEIFIDLFFDEKFQEKFEMR